jgi:hypothetical protein
MSARDRLTEALMNPGLVGLRREEADELIDGFAHELAEKIRKQTARGNLIRVEFADPWEMGLLRASDVIDPWPDGEPSAGPVRPDEEPT